MLGQHGGAGVVARAKVRTVKVEDFFLIDFAKNLDKLNECSYRPPSMY